MSNIENLLSPALINIYEENSAKKDFSEQVADALLWLPRSGIGKQVNKLDIHTQFTYADQPGLLIKVTAIALSILLSPILLIGVGFAHQSATLKSKMIEYKIYEKKYHEIIKLINSTADIGSFIKGVEFERAYDIKCIFKRMPIRKEQYEEVKNAFYEKYGEQVFALKMRKAAQKGTTATKEKVDPHGYFHFRDTRFDKERLAMGELKFAVSLLEHVVHGKKSLDESLAAIISASMENPGISELEFYHGTGIGTLPLMMRTDKQLIPAGKLIAEGKTLVCGENNNGALGINKRNLSGVTKEGLSGALSYASRDDTFSTTPAIIQAASSAPDFVLNMFSSIFEGDQQNIQELENLFSDEQELRNYIIAFRTVAMIFPEEVEAKLLPKVKKIIEALDSAGNASMIEKLSNFSQINKLSEPLNRLETAWIIHRFPLLIGASDLDKANLQTRSSIIKGEQMYENSLTLGKEIKYLFVPLSQVEEVNKYVIEQFKSTGLPPKVLPIEVFEFKEKAASYKKKKTGIGI